MSLGKRTPDRQSARNTSNNLVHYIKSAFQYLYYIDFDLESVGGRLNSIIRWRNVF